MRAALRIRPPPAGWALGRARPKSQFLLPPYPPGSPARSAGPPPPTRDTPSKNGLFFCPFLDRTKCRPRCENGANRLPKSDPNPSQICLERRSKTPFKKQGHGLRKRRYPGGPDMQSAHASAVQTQFFVFALLPKNPLKSLPNVSQSLPKSFQNRHRDPPKNAPQKRTAKNADSAGTVPKMTPKGVQIGVYFTPWRHPFCTFFPLRAPGTEKVMKMSPGD